MDSKTIDWFARLPWWLLIVLRELPESGEAYLGRMMVPVAGGMTAAIMVALLPLLISELGPWWWAFILGAVLIYLFAGIVAYFSADSTSYGPWQERGAW